MLFNSYVFSLIFLPIVLGVFLALKQLRMVRWTIPWLVLASLFFYGWWNPRYLVLILSSIGINFLLGAQIIRSTNDSTAGKVYLTLGVVFNLGALFYFKYMGFFAANVATIFNSDLHVRPVVLPLAISFFTFQQIAYLVDAYRGQADEHNILHYALFVTFFPQLIAGPIVHHREMLPQFQRTIRQPWAWSDGAVGVTLFVVGLSKKVIVADGIARFGTPVFAAAAAGVDPTLLEAWGGALAYTFQLYFDFSGYSDMAIGIARMFGIRLPVNFFSPYKATSIIEFWRRWHMTLSRFLLDYLYIPLGGNRNGPFARYRNLMITMVIGGLWHGAAWTFVAWGALHGLYLVINHAWRRLRGYLPGIAVLPASLRTGLSRVMTFLAVVIGWVFFRSESFGAAGRVLRGMAGLNGFVLTARQYAILEQVPGASALVSLFNAHVLAGGEGLPHFRGAQQVVLLLILLCLVWFAPNSIQLMRMYRPAMLGKIRVSELRSRLAWKPNIWWSVGVGLAATWTLVSMNRIQEFLYFQF